MNGPHMWWGVQLYCIPSGSSFCQLLPKAVDQYFYQTPPSDGEVFLRVRNYEESGITREAALWRLKLSKCKQKILRAVQRDGRLLEKLNQLHPFHGLWDSFQLGNMERHMAIHATDEVLHYLQHIYETWDLITLGEPTIQCATDIQTVSKLELLVPAASKADAAVVQELVASGALFPSISEPATRSRIERKILQISVLIPSLKTFHQNMKLLSIGARILREYVIDDLKIGSVRNAMAGCWQPPKRLLVEERENTFRQLDLEPTADLAYRQVFMAALRNFPRLSTTSPRCERGQRACQAMVDDSYLAQFLRGVQTQGFRSHKLEGTVARLSECRVPQADSNAEPPFTEKELERRCGRPFSRSFALLSSFFLPNILISEDYVEQPSTLFIQEDFMRSFFGGDPSVMGTIAAALKNSPDSMVIQDARGGNVPGTLETTPNPTVGCPSSRMPTLHTTHPHELHDYMAMRAMDVDTLNTAQQSEPVTMIPRREHMMMGFEPWSLLRSSSSPRSHCRLEQAPKSARGESRSQSPMTGQSPDFPHRICGSDISLPSSGTAFSPRSLILPEELRSDYHSSRQALSSGILGHNIRAWRTDSARSEDSPRSIFGPQD